MNILELALSDDTITPIILGYEAWLQEIWINLPNSPVQTRIIELNEIAWGLSIVKRIVEKLNGEVGVESANIPGEGSRFYFVLPLENQVQAH